jgi:hypothetical protein
MIEDRKTIEEISLLYQDIEYEFQIIINIINK